MSADNITVCPKCRKHKLREYKECGIYEDGDGVFYYYNSYRAECRECEFTYTVPESRRRIRI